MMWLVRAHNPLRHPPARTILALLALLLTLGGHHLSMAGEGLARGLPGPPGTERSAIHVHCAACEAHPLHALSHLVTPPADETCGPLTPWKTAGGDGGERLERDAPVIAAPALATDTGPIPDDPPHRDPPAVRRAFLQVYLN